jgi:hypothetical protein
MKVQKRRHISVGNSFDFLRGYRFDPNEVTNTQDGMTLSLF